MFQRLVPVKSILDGTALTGQNRGEQIVNRRVGIDYKQALVTHYGQYSTVVSTLKHCKYHPYGCLRRLRQVRNL